MGHRNFLLRDCINIKMASQNMDPAAASSNSSSLKGSETSGSSAKGSITKRLQQELMAYLHFQSRKTCSNGSEQSMEHKEPYTRVYAISYRWSFPVGILTKHLGSNSSLPVFIRT